MSPAPYRYPVPNSELIKKFDLEKHFEGGFFSQRISLDSYSSAENAASSQALKGRRLTEWGPDMQRYRGGYTTAPKEEEHGKRIEATSIYYLLTSESYRGKMHMNIHAHFHCLHAGRARYTLIKPPGPDESAPEVVQVVLGHDVTKGEVPQLFVPGGFWKASELLEEDLQSASTAEEKDRIGCLISEIVVPGWTPEQHLFIDEQKLRAMWKAGDEWKMFSQYLKSAP